MAGTRKLTIEVLGDTTSGSRALKTLGDDAETHFGKIAKFGKIATVAMAGVAGGLLAGASSALKAAEESQKISKITEQIVKSTGGAANLSAQQVGKLADALSRKTGIDDEAIQKGENLLLTFTKIQDKAGEGNQIFSRASAAMLDLGTVFGSSDAAAMQLGKALNDPVKGISALARAGVQFTADQKETIKSLVETGDVLDAQKIILKEVETQVGGTAEAQATAADKAKVAWGNLQEKIGGQLMPVMTAFSNWTVQTLIPALGSASDWVELHVIPALQHMGAWVRDNVLPVLATLATDVREAWPKVVAALTSALNTMKALWQRWGDDVGQIVGALVKMFEGVFAGIKLVVAGLVDFISGVFTLNWSKAWNGIKEIAHGVFVAIVDGFGPLLARIGTAIAGYAPEVGKKLLEWTGEFVSWVASLPAKMAGAIANLAKAIASAVYNALKNAITDAISWGSDPSYDAVGFKPGATSGSSSTSGGFAGASISKGVKSVASSVHSNNVANPEIAKILDAFSGVVSNMGVFGSRQHPSDHTTGNAVDLGVKTIEAGNAVVKSLLATEEHLKYIIFNKRIYQPDGSSKPFVGTYASGEKKDPHTDHVHVSLLENVVKNAGILGAGVGAAGKAAKTTKAIEDTATTSTKTAKSMAKAVDYAALQLSASDATKKGIDILRAQGYDVDTATRMFRDDSNRNAFSAQEELKALQAKYAAGTKDVVDAIDNIDFGKAGSMTVNADVVYVNGSINGMGSGYAGSRGSYGPDTPTPMPNWPTIVPPPNGGGIMDGYGTGQLPALAEGGIVRATSGGRVVRVAEGGKDEAIVPLSSAGIGGVTVNVYVAGSIAAERDLARRIGEEIARQRARGINV